MSDWQPMTIKPPRPGQYHVRVRITEGRYLSKLVRYWDGTQWSSRNGRLPTGFGNWGDSRSNSGARLLPNPTPHPVYRRRRPCLTCPTSPCWASPWGAVVALALALHRWLSREIESEEREE